MRAIHALNQPEGPEVEQGGTARQRLSNLPEQENLGGTDEEESASLAPVREQLHDIEQARLLLYLVEHYQARSVVQPADRVCRQAQALVGVVEREIDGCIAAGRQEVPDERRFAGLAGAREDGDRPGRQSAAEQVDRAPRVKGRQVVKCCSATARFQGRFA